MEIEFIQSLISKAVRLATSLAMNGTPVRDITWIPSRSASGNPDGSFSVTYENMNISASQKHSWE